MAQAGLVGYQFDKMRVTPGNEALMNGALVPGSNSFVIAGYKNACVVTADGTTSVVIDTGAMIIEGRSVEVLSPITVPVPSANGTYTLACKIDLSQANSATGNPLAADYEVTNNQVSFVVIQGDSYQGAVNSNLIQEDIHNAGLVYMHPLAQIVRTSSALTAKSEMGYFYNLLPWMANGFTAYDSKDYAWRLGVAKFGGICTLVGNVKGTVAHASGSTLRLLKESNPYQFLNGAHPYHWFVHLSGQSSALLSTTSGNGLQFDIERVVDLRGNTGTSNNEWIGTSGFQWTIIGADGYGMDYKKGMSN